MLADFTTRTIRAVLGHRAHHHAAAYSYDYKAEWTPLRRQVEYNEGFRHDEVIDQRTKDSCHVERVNSSTEIGPDEVKVVVRQLAGYQGSMYQYKCKRFALLRRILNAYTVEIGRNNDHFRLSYKGNPIYRNDTAESLGFTGGETLDVRFVFDEIMPWNGGSVKSESEESY